MMHAHKVHILVSLGPLNSFIMLIHDTLLSKACQDNCQSGKNGTKYTEI